MCSSNGSNLMSLTRSDQGWRNENWRNIRAISSWTTSQILFSSLTTRKPTGRQEGLVIDAKNVPSALQGVQTLSFQPFFISSHITILHFCQWPFFHPTQPLPNGLERASSHEGKASSLCVLGVNECEERFFFLYVFYTLCSWLLEVPQ